MFKSQLNLVTNDPMVVWMGRIVFLLMLAVLVVINAGGEVHEKVILTVTTLGGCSVSAWMFERLCLAKRIRATQRVLRRLGDRADRDDQLKEILRQVLADQIAEEILAVERVNRVRARELKAEFKRLHEDGQILGLIPKGEKWDEYFTRATGGPRTREEQDSLNRKGRDEMALQGLNVEV